LASAGSAWTRPASASSATPHGVEQRLGADHVEERLLLAGEGCLLSVL